MLESFFLQTVSSVICFAHNVVVSLPLSATEKVASSFLLLWLLVAEIPA